MGRRAIYTPEQRIEKRKESDHRYRQKHAAEIKARLYKWRAANPERWNAFKRKSNHKRYLQLRSQILALFGSKCAYCGYAKDPRAFQIDHINGGGCRERKIFKAGTDFAQHVLAVGGEGYQLLCANCNQIKRFGNKEDFKYKME